MKAIIIEDEIIAAERLSQLLKEVSEDIIIEKKLTSIAESILYLKNHKAPDVIFMDIHLSDGLAFNIIDELSLESPIIFISAYSDFATETLKANTVDYLNKPVKIDELINAIHKIPTTVPIAQAFQPNKLNSTINYLIKFGKKYYLTNADDIAYVYSSEDLSVLVRKDGIRLPVGLKMDNIEEDLDSSSFIRVNHFVLVNIEAIQSLDYASDLPLIDVRPNFEHEIQVTKPYQQGLQSWLADHFY